MYLITTSLQSSNESVNNHELNELNAAELANNNNSSGVLVSVNGGEFQIQVGADEASLIRDPRLPNDGRNNYSEYLDSGTLEPRILSKVSSMIHSLSLFQLVSFIFSTNFLDCFDIR